MARIQMGVIVTDIRGKLAGNQFSKTRAGNILQRKCGQRKGSTPAQSIMRGRFAEFSRYWRTISQADRDANNTNTSSYPILDKFGNTTYLSGYQLLLRSNINLATLEAPPISVVPGTPPAGAGIVITNSEITVGSSGVISATQAWINPTGDYLNKTMVLYASPGVSQGVSIYNGRYVIYGPVDIAGLIADFTIMFGSVLANPQNGDKVFIIMDLVDNATGVVVNSYTNAIIVASFSFNWSVTLTSGVSFNYFAAYSDGSSNVPTGMRLDIYYSNGVGVPPDDFESLVYTFYLSKAAGVFTNPFVIGSSATTGTTDYSWFKAVLINVATGLEVDTNYSLIQYNS